MHYTTTSNIEAWTHWVKGLHHFRQSVTAQTMAVALSHWRQALSLDPGSSALHAMVGFIHYLDARFGWWQDRPSAVAEALAHTGRALDLDPLNPDANTAESCALLLERRYEEAAAYARRAVHLAPSSADVATFACFVLAFAGYPQEAVAHGERAMTLSPHRPAFYWGHLGNAYRLAGRMQDAIAAFQAYHARSPGFGLSDLVLAYRQLGEPDMAAEVAGQLLSVRRDFTVELWAKTQCRADVEGLKADVAALRAAGIPAH
jgi:adenylate cyclase